MMLRIVVCAILFSAVSFTQSPAVKSDGPRFEVVAIKPAPEPTPATIQAGTSRIAFNVDAARVQIKGYTPFLLLARAFRVDLQQVDAPDFARSEYFEIQAALPAGATREQVPEMLQAMLAERFKLIYHRETREYQMSVLSVGKNGMNLPRLPDDTQMRPSQDRLPDGTTRMTQIGKVASLFPVMNSFGGLQMVDETGLDGIYAWVRILPPRTPDVSFQEATQDAFKAMIEACRY